MRAYVALGSNQDDPRQQVLDALDALGHLPDTRVVRRSALYRTPPWGVTDQPDFVKRRAELDTELLPHALMRGAAGDRAGGRPASRPSAGGRARSIWICCMYEWRSAGRRRA